MAVPPSAVRRSTKLSASRRFPAVAVEAPEAAERLEPDQLERLQGNLAARQFREPGRQVPQRRLHARRPRYRHRILGVLRREQAVEHKPLVGEAERCQLPAGALRLGERLGVGPGHQDHGGLRAV